MTTPQGITGRVDMPIRKGMRLRTIQQDPGYHEGFYEAMVGEPLFPDASNEYAAGWLAYWNCRAVIDAMKTTV